MRRSEIHEAKCREWSKRIRDWSASSLTKVEWCSKNHVSVKCLQYWLKRIPESAQANHFSSQSADVPGNNNDFFEFVPVAASGSKSASGVTDKPASTVSPELTIHCGRFSLKLSDVNIDADEPYLRIHGKGDKVRIVSLSEKTIPLVKQYIRLYHKDMRIRSTPFIYTVIKGEIGRMSERNVERIVQKYADIIRKENPDIPTSVYPHMLRRTRATGMYRDGVPIETIAVILGHADAKTTRKSYASPSVEMLREQMTAGTEAEPDVAKEQPLWDNDEELAKLCGLR